MFGLFEGGVDLKLDNANCRFGERLKGTAYAKLKKPEPANGFYVHLIGECKQTRNELINGRYQSRTETVNVFKSTVTLAEKQTYLDQSYPFEIQLPANPGSNASTPSTPGLVGDVFRTLSQVNAPGPIQWYVEAHLDLPMAFAMRKRVSINLG